MTTARIWCVVYIATALFCETTTLADLPRWIERPPQDDSQYRFYVGRASDSSTEAAGFTDAFRTAEEAAIRENYGFRTQIQKDQYSDQTSDVLLNRISESSVPVQLVGFEQVDSYRLEDSKHRWSVWVLYRYPKAEIQSERARLKSLALSQPNQKERLRMSSTGTEDLNIKGGSVEISTEPIDATVLIDGERWGATPLQIAGKLSQGLHQVTLDHPAFVTLVEKLIISNHTKARLHKVLTPAFGGIRVRANAPSANVAVKGEVLGQVPTQLTKLRAGETVAVQVSHPDYYSQSQEVVIQKGQLQEMFFDLKMKEAFLGIPSLPSGSDLVIDQQTIPLPKRKGVEELQWVQVTPGGHSYQLAVPGCPDKEGSLTVPGLARKVASDIKACTHPNLVNASTVKENEVSAAAPSINSQFGAVVGIHASGFAAPYGGTYGQAGVRVYTHLFDHLFRTSILLNSSMSMDEGKPNQKYSFLGGSIELMRPFLVYQSTAKTLYLGPTAGYTFQSYSISSISNPSLSTSTTIHQANLGATLMFGIEQNSYTTTFELGLEECLTLNYPTQVFSGSFRIGVTPKF